VARRLSFPGKKKKDDEQGGLIKNTEGDPDHEFPGHGGMTLGVGKKETMKVSNFVQGTWDSQSGGN